MNWSLEGIDRVLEKLLPLNSKREYDHACSDLASELECGVADVRCGDRMVRDGNPINRLLWGMCVRVRDYTGPCYVGYPGSRTRRHGPFSWVETQCLKWAVYGDSKYKKYEISPEYMANILQRDLKEVLVEMLKIGPAKGRVGFFS